jgi:hypothetical protein
MKNWSHPIGQNLQASPIRRDNAYLQYKVVSTGNGTMSFTEKQHIQIYNNPRSPQCHTEPELLCPSQPPSYFITIYL